MKKNSFWNKCKREFHEIHHYLLKLPLDTKKKVMGV